MKLSIEDCEPSYLIGYIEDVVEEYDCIWIGGTP